MYWWNNTVENEEEGRLGAMRRRMCAGRVKGLETLREPVFNFDVLFFFES